jgi:zinc protease
LSWIETHWGGWERGGHEAKIPPEPPQQGPRSATVDFHAPTLPIVQISFKAPAYDDEQIDSAALDLISFYAFSESSELYQRLVIEEQTVDMLAPQYYDHLDPFPFSVVARVKDAADIGPVQRAILETFQELKEKPIPAQRLEAIKSHLRYSFALGMNSTAAIADTLAHYLGLRRTPETINKRYRLYASVTADDIRQAAGKYFVDNGRTIVTLRHAADQEAGQ